MPTDPRQLKPGELIRLINSTPLGDVHFGSTQRNIRLEQRAIKTLHSHYGQLTGQERFPLILAAGVRNDAVEQNRLCRPARG